MTVHVLKCWPGPFRESVAGRKPYEIRKNDRDYQVGDILILREWDPVLERCSGDYAAREVTCMTRGGAWNLPPELCVLGLKPTAVPVHASRLDHPPETWKMYNPKEAKIAGPWAAEPNEPGERHGRDFSRPVVYAPLLVLDAVQKGYGIARVYMNQTGTRAAWSVLLSDDQDKHGQAPTLAEAQEAADAVLLAAGWILR